MGKYCSNSKCFKEKNYKAKFLTSLILKKIKSTNIFLKKKQKKPKKNERKKERKKSILAIHSKI
jgi:hypothetical protein